MTFRRAISLLGKEHWWRDGVVDLGIGIDTGGKSQTIAPKRKDVEAVSRVRTA